MWNSRRDIGRRWPRGDRASGFTLVELLVLVAILCLMAVTVIISLGSIG